MENNLNGKVSGYSHDGAGVIRSEEIICFVPGALKDEEIIYQIDVQDSLKRSGAGVKTTKKKKAGVAFGTVTQILKPSDQRAVPSCAYYHLCGGCQLQHATYEHQLQIKDEIVARAFRGMGKDWQGWEKIRPILGAQSPQRYRNKGIFAVQKQGQEIKLGFYQKKSRQVAGNGCPSLFSLAVNGLIQALSFWLTEHEVTVGPEGLHHVMIRESRTTGHLIIVLISSGAKPQWLAEFLQTFVPVEQKDLPPCARKTKQLLSGIGWLAAPDKQGPVISGKPETLWGKLVLVEQLGHIKYGISAESFFQVNTEQAKTLYDQVVQMAGLTGQEHVWDIYCGTGTIGLYLANRAKSVLGIESVARAVKDGQANARINDIKNVQFIAAYAEDVMATWMEQGMATTAETEDAKEKEQNHKAGITDQLIAGIQLPDVVILDPPSKGCERPVIEGILAVKPARIVYVSCDPATLVRDLKLLTASGMYEIEQVQPVDMFPQTGHVEAIILLQRVDVN